MNISSPSNSPGPYSLAERLRFPALQLTTLLLLATVGVTSAQDIVATGDVSPGPVSSPIWSPDFLYVGNAGSGSLSISGSGAVSSFTGYIGNIAGSEGLVEVSGGSWTNTSELFVGNSGSGILRISGTGTASGNTTFIGDSPGSVGLVEVSGSGSWMNSSIVVGYEGNGTLTLSGNASVTASIVHMTYESGSTGTLNLFGGTLTAFNIVTSNSALNAGSTRQVRFDGGTLRLSGDQSYLFNNFEAGDVVMTGNGGTIDTEAFAATISAGLGGDGSLIKQGSGSLTLTGNNTYAGDTVVRNGSLVVTGTISDPSANVVVGELSGDDSTFEISETGSVSNTIGMIGSDSGSTGLVKVSGGRWTNSSFLYVGLSGNGTLEVDESGTVSNTFGSIGFEAGSTGVATVNGGRWTNTGALYVGYSGTGTLEVSGTGAVTSTNGNIGLESGSTGTVKITDGRWTNSSFLVVGVSGEGSLEISGTGAVSNTFASIASSPDSVGSVKVSGGTWTNSGPLTVGDAGDGSLEISGTGAVSNTSAMIGSSFGSKGTVKVSDGRWTNSSSLTVGFVGTGTLEISGTGIVTNTNGNIGYASDSTGTAKVTGGSWSNSGILTVGDTGNGILEISETGAVSASSVRVANNSGAVGVLNLHGGTLTTRQLAKGAGDGSVTFDGGTLQLSGNQADLFAGFAAGEVALVDDGGTIDTQTFTGESSQELSGNGSLTKTGGGTLRLTGANTYTGATTVEEGALIVDGSLASDVTVQNGASLGGDGVVGAIVLESGSVLRPIDCFDANSVTWQSDATMTFSLSDGFSDILETSGALTKDGIGTFAFTFLDAGWVQDQTYELIVFDTTNFLAQDFSFTNVGGFAGVFALNDNVLEFTLTTVPEPAASALLGLGVAAFLLHRRIKGRRAASDRCS